MPFTLGPLTVDVKRGIFVLDESALRTLGQRLYKYVILPILKLLGYGLAILTPILLFAYFSFIRYTVAFLVTLYVLWLLGSLVVYGSPWVAGYLLRYGKIPVCTCGHSYNEHGDHSWCNLRHADRSTFTLTSPLPILGLATKSLSFLFTHF